MSFDNMPWSAQLVFTVIITMAAGLLVAWLIKRSGKLEREQRAIAKRNKLRRWLRLAEDEIDRSYANGQFSVGRDAKDKWL